MAGVVVLATTVEPGRRRAAGQGGVMEWGIALALGAGIILVWSQVRQGQDQLRRAIGIADQTTYVADAETKYLVRNYTAFEQWFSAPNVAQTLEFTPSCMGGGPCKMPAVGTPVGLAYGTANWQSLADASLLPPEQVNVDQAGQPYRLVVHCSQVTNLSCTQLSAMLATYGGPPVLDGLNGRIAASIGPRAGFIPLDPTITGTYETPNWITNWALWSVGGTPRATPGHIAMTLDLDIGKDIATGQIHRYGGGDDTRPQTMGRTVYMAKSSLDQSPANICFCGTDGYYHNLCRYPNTAGVADTPASPNFCGVQP